MSAALVIVVGLVLCFAGAFSVRLAVLTAGFGTGWLFAGVFDASTSAALVIAVAAAAATFLASFLLAKSLFLVAGVVVGSVVGAKLFVVLDIGPGAWLTAVIAVPAFALVCGWLAARWEKRFLRWITAAAGAALLLSGVGRSGAEGTDHLWQPGSSFGAVLLGSLWVALTFLGHRVQSRRGRKATPADERTG